MFKNITAFEVAFVIKLDMDRGMDGDKFLECASVPEPSHLFLPSSEWLI